MKTIRVRYLALVMVFVFALMSCAATTISMDEMTPAQKYDTYRTTFNDVIEYQYLPWAKIQPETTKVILRSEVNPMIKRAEQALDVYGKEVATPGGDPEAKLNLYLGIKNDLYILLLKYGLKIDESKGDAK